MLLCFRLLCQSWSLSMAKCCWREFYANGTVPLSGGKMSTLNEQFGPFVMLRHKNLRLIRVACHLTFPWPGQQIHVDHDWFRNISADLKSRSFHCSEHQVLRIGVFHSDSQTSVNDQHAFAVVLGLFWRRPKRECELPITIARPWIENYACAGDTKHRNMYVASSLFN